VICSCSGPYESAGGPPGIRGASAFSFQRGGGRRGGRGGSRGFFRCASGAPHCHKKCARLRLSIPPAEERKEGRREKRGRRASLPQYPSCAGGSLPSRSTPSYFCPGEKGGRGQKLLCPASRIVWWSPDVSSGHRRTREGGKGGGTKTPRGVWGFPAPQNRERPMPVQRWGGGGKGGKKGGKREEGMDYRRLASRWQSCGHELGDARAGSKKEGKGSARTPADSTWIIAFNLRK